MDDLQNLNNLLVQPDLTPAMGPLKEELNKVEFTKWKELILKKKT